MGLEAEGGQSQGSGAINMPNGFPGEDWLLGKAKHLNKAFEDWFEPYRRRMEENYKIWWVDNIAGMMPGATSLPTGNSIIETAQSRYMGIAGAREKLIEAIQKTVDEMTDDADERVQLMQSFINESILNIPQYFEKIDDAVHIFLIEAGVVYETFWNTEVNKSVEPQRQTAGIGQAPVVNRVEVETTKEFPDLRVISKRFLAWDPRCKTQISKSPWIRKRSMVSANDLLTMEQDGVLEGAQAVIEKAPKANPAGDQQKDPDARQSSVVQGHNLPAINFDDGIFQLDEWWAKLAWKDEAGKMVQDEYSFWIVGEEKLVKFRDNPFLPKRKPFVSVNLDAKPGPLDVVKGLLKEGANNMSRKARLIANAANSPTFYEPSSGLDGRRTVLQENALIPVLNVKGIQRFEPPVAALGLIRQDLDWTINKAIEATPSTEQAQGIQGNDAPETATENEIIDRSSNSRFQYSYGMFAAQSFPYIAEEFLLLYRQLGKEDQMTVREAGQEGKARAVTLDDLKGMWEFRAAVSPSAQNKERRFALLKGVVTEAAQAFAANPNIFTAKDGSVMKPTVFDFMKDDMLPLLDIKTNSLFTKTQPLPMGPLPMDGAGAGALAPPMQGAPAPGALEGALA